MALSELEIKRCEKELEKYLKIRRPPPEIRDKVDISYRIVDQSVELFEVRPLWNDPLKKIELAIAKTTYIKKNKHWKIFWQRQDLKWHAYDPQANVKTFAEFLSVVDEDKHACFFG